MKKLLLTTMLCSTILLNACAGAPALFTVAAAGTAINVENSGNPVESAGEATDRITADVKKGYSGTVTPDGRYGPVYQVNE